MLAPSLAPSAPPFPPAYASPSARLRSKRHATKRALASTKLYAAPPWRATLARKTQPRTSGQPPTPAPAVEQAAAEPALAVAVRVAARDHEAVEHRARDAAGHDVVHVVGRRVRVADLAAQHGRVRERVARAPGRARRRGSRRTSSRPRRAGSSPRARSPRRARPRGCTCPARPRPRRRRARARERSRATGTRPPSTGRSRRASRASSSAARRARRRKHAVRGRRAARAARERGVAEPARAGRAPGAPRASALRPKADTAITAPHQASKPAAAIRARRRTGADTASPYADLHGRHGRSISSIRAEGQFDTDANKIIGRPIRTIGVWESAPTPSALRGAVLRDMKLRDKLRRRRLNKTTVVVKKAAGSSKKVESRRP